MVYYTIRASFIILRCGESGQQLALVSNFCRSGESGGEWRKGQVIKLFCCHISAGVESQMESGGKDQVINLFCCHISAGVETQVGYGGKSQDNNSLCCTVLSEWMPDIAIVNIPIILTLTAGLCRSNQC